MGFAYRLGRVGAREWGWADGWVDRLWRFFAPVFGVGVNVNGDGLFANVWL